MWFASFEWSWSSEFKSFRPTTVTSFCLSVSKPHKHRRYQNFFHYQNHILLQPTSPVMIKNVLTTVRTYNLDFVLNSVNSLQFYIHSIFPISSVVSLDTRACGIREYDPPFCFLMLVVCIKMWCYMQFLFCTVLRPQSAACKSENKTNLSKNLSELTFMWSDISWETVHNVFVVGYKRYFHNTKWISKYTYVPEGVFMTVGKMDGWI